MDKSGPSPRMNLWSPAPAGADYLMGIVPGALPPANVQQSSRLVISGRLPGSRPRIISPEGYWKLAGDGIPGKSPK
jgi:hypothetical protein